MGPPKTQLLAVSLVAILLALDVAARGDVAAGDGPLPASLVVSLSGPAPAGLEVHATPRSAPADAIEARRAFFRSGRARLSGLPPGVSRLHLRLPTGADAAGPALLWVPVETSGDAAPAAPELTREVEGRMADFMAAWKAQDIDALASFYHPSYRGSSGESRSDRLALLGAAARASEIVGLDHRVLAVAGSTDAPRAWVESVSLVRDRTTGRVSPRRTLLEVRLRRDEGGALALVRTERAWLPAEALDPANTVRYGLGSVAARVELEPGRSAHLTLDPGALR